MLKNKKMVFIVSGLILIGVLFFIFLSRVIFLKKQKKFNVVLIVIDALRRDHLGCYGYGRDTSPNIDRFAKNAILFKNAFSQGSATRISVPSLFTSLYPSVHKVYALNSRLADNFATLAEILQNDGYTTAAFVPANLMKSYNLAQGFELYGELPTSSASAKITTQNVIEWLKRKHQYPFFLYIHYFGAHAPYNPPSPYDRFFWQEPVDEEMKEFSQHFARTKDFDPLKSGLIPSNSKIVSYLLAQYDGKIRYVDDQIRVLLEELEKSGIAKNTLFILTADHGEEFLDHGNLMHGLPEYSVDQGFFHERSLYDELIHVPLIMRLPQELAISKIIPDLVRHIDIMPTILDVLDISFGNIVQGSSLMPLIKGKSKPKPESFSEGYYGRHLIGVRTEKNKFVEAYDYLRTNSYSYELYDLEEDPKELNNLAEGRPREVELFKARLKDYGLECDKIRKSILGRNFKEEPVVLDGQTKERLKSLGYVQ